VHPKDMKNMFKNAKHPFLGMFMFLFFYVKIFFSIDDEEENPCSIST
jgi:hypothetical protein